MNYTRYNGLTNDELFSICDERISFYCWIMRNQKETHFGGFFLDFCLKVSYNK